MVSFKEYLKVKEELLNEDIADKLYNLNNWDTEKLLNITTRKINKILDNGVKRDELESFFVWVTIFFNFDDINKTITTSTINKTIDQKLVSKIDDVYKQMDQKIKKAIMNNLPNPPKGNSIGIKSICERIYNASKGYKKFSELFDKIEGIVVNLFVPAEDEDDKLSDEIEDEIKELSRKITDKDDKKTLEEIMNKSDKDEEDLQKVEELKKKYSIKQNEGIPPTTDNSTEDGNSGANTQVSNSNTSSSFSKDDWETLFKEKNEAEIEKILNKVASNTISKMEKILNDRASQVLKDKDLMKEDAQEELWNIINERINLGNGSYLERDKGKSVNMYKDGSVGKNNDGSINAGNANDTLEHYKKEIEFMTLNTAGRIAEINGNRSFNSSDGKLNKLRNQVRSVVLDYHNELLDIKNEFDKKISKVGLFQKFKINKARQKEKDDAYFNSSEQGEMYDNALKEKTNQIYNAFNSILKRSQVKTFDDMVAKQLATLAATCGSVKDFKDACASKIVLTENGGTMNALDYLINKGIKISSFKGAEHKQSGLNYKAYSDAFNKFKQGLANNEKYDDPTKIKNLIDAINKETSENRANDSGLTVEASLIRKALKKDETAEQKREPNNGTQGQDLKTFDDLMKRKQSLEEIEKYIANLISTKKVSEDLLKKHIEEKGFGQKLPADFWSNVEQRIEQTNMTVTTKACDGLPVGARKYSRAIRRRMNYALNKYM